MKVHVLGTIKKYGVFASNKTCFGRICACNIGDLSRSGPKKLFIEEEPPGVAKDKYDPTFVHGMFVRSFSLGLQNENIKIEISLTWRRKLLAVKSYSRK